MTSNAKIGLGVTVGFVAGFVLGWWLLLPQLRHESLEHQKYRYLAERFGSPTEVRYYDMFNEQRVLTEELQAKVNELEQQLSANQQP